jgi:hypothetical protein
MYWSSTGTVMSAVSSADRVHQGGHGVSEAGRRDRATEGEAHRRELRQCGQDARRGGMTEMASGSGCALHGGPRWKQIGCIPNLCPRGWSFQLEIPIGVIAEIDQLDGINRLYR